MFFIQARDLFLPDISKNTDDCNTFPGDIPAGHWSLSHARFFTGGKPGVYPPHSLESSTPSISSRLPSCQLAPSETSEAHESIKPAATHKYCFHPFIT